MTTALALSARPVWWTVNGITRPWSEIKLRPAARCSPPSRTTARGTSSTQRSSSTRLMTSRPGGNRTPHGWQSIRQPTTGGPMETERISSMWKAFLKAMAAAAISGAAGAASAVSNTPDATLKQIGQSSLVGAAVGTSLFLAKSPLPADPAVKKDTPNGPPNA